MCIILALSSFFFFLFLQARWWLRISVWKRRRQRFARSRSCCLCQRCFNRSHPSRLITFRANRFQFYSIWFSLLYDICFYFFGCYCCCCVCLNLLFRLCDSRASVWATWNFYFIIIIFFLISFSGFWFGCYRVGFNCLGCDTWDTMKGIYGLYVNLCFEIWITL